MSFGPKGKLILAGGTDSLARLWRVDGMELLHTLDGHESTVYGSAFDPAGRLAATACAEGRVCFWDVESGELQRTVETGARVSHIAFGADGKLLYGSGQSGVHVWDAATGERRADLADFEGAVIAIAVHPAGHTLAAACRDGRVRLWSLRSGELVRSLAPPDGTVPSAVALHPRRPLVAAGSSEGQIAVWDLSSGELVETEAGHEGKVHGLVFDAGGKRLASGGQDKTIRLWRVLGRVRSL